MFPAFIFATGIENSYPRVGTRRVDGMAAAGHDRRFAEDFALTRELGLRFLRWGPPIHQVWLADGHYDWDWTDAALSAMRDQGVLPVLDLCHFGVPDWVGDFQNGDFPALFARYAAAFARRYPWIQLWTPVNEMFVCAQFSGRYGWWNEGLRTDRGFVTALKHLVKANVLAMEAILPHRPDALFIQSESSEYFHAESPEAIAPAEAMNQQRFLSLDLNYGRRVDSGMYEFLLDNGMTREEYHFFLGRGLRRRCVMGTDYYVTNEHLMHPDGHTEASGEVFGYAEITRQYHDRYRLPVMHTETNLAEGPNGDEAVVWLRKQWANALRIRNSGIPLLGFTWYSLTDQLDWDTALREANGHVNPLGLYDLDRRRRRVGDTFAKIVAEWSSVLPTQSESLVLPVLMEDAT